MDATLKLLSEYGLQGFILLTVSIFVSKVLVTKYKGSLSKLASTFSSGGASEAELRYHPFFSSAHHKIVAEIPVLELAPNKPVKQQMFRDVLTIYIKAMLNNCNAVVTEDMDDWSGDKWANEVSRHVNRMVTEFQETCIAQGVPSEAVAKFLKWHYPTLEMLYDYITKLGNSNIYTTNLLRTSTFLMTMNLLLVTTLGDAERSLKELNGEVGGKQYKNMTLEH
jgi:hypothetical protein